MFAKHTQGTVLRQAQTTWPSGTFEEHHGREGFAGDCSQLYRRHPTTDWTRVEGPIRPRGLNLDDLPAQDAGDPRAMPTLLLYNEDMSLSVSKRTTATPFYFRNADGDTTVVIQRGNGRLVCDYGLLEYGPLEYLVIPKGTNYKLVPDGDETLAYLLETRSAIRIPDRALLGHFLPFDIGVLDVPQLPLGGYLPAADADDHDEWEIVVKRAGELSSIFYDFDPMDVEGWQGTVTPFRLRLEDIRPLTSERLDVPPVTHATFETDGVWLVTMCPRPWQSGDAAPVQPYHRNVDYDEVFITLGGGDGAVKRPAGLMSVTPAGMNHGPAARVLETRLERFPFYLLNIDASRPLRFTEAFERFENEHFADTQRFRIRGGT